MFSTLRVLAIIVLVLGVSVFMLGDAPRLPVSTAWADDYEDEDDEEDDDREDEKKSSSKQETVTRTYTVIQKVPQTVVVTPVEFLSDRDGDLLVDALDPDPDTHQREYFTDDDGDRVANVNDRYPGRDDFSIFEDGTDVNANGIVDSYEF